ncbi:MAG: DUF4381 domain-containing protein [Gammaproteobacteria bacterium]|jgi:hypothetical protein
MKPDLSQLRDIHLPAPVSWWPPAPGWWGVLALLLLVGALAYVVYIRRRRNRWRRTALSELDGLRDAAPEQMLRGLSVLLRRVAVSRFPRRDVAALTGEAWLAFLDRSLGDGTAFQSGAGRVLISGPYTSDVQVDGASLLALCEHWIKRLPARGAA